MINEITLTIILSLLYITGGIVFFGICFLGGLVIFPPLREKRFPDFVWGVLLRCGLGMAMISGIVIWAGIFSLMHLELIAAAFIVILVSGIILLSFRIRTDFQSIRNDLYETIRKQSNQTKIWCVVSIIFLGLLFLNLVIGSLVPDMTQDAAWYHLAVPGQWIFRGEAAAFPGCFPSCYPLAMEAIYVPLLMAGDEILCNVVYSFTGMLLFLGIIFLTWKKAGFHAALFGGIPAIFFYSALNAKVPVSTGNDHLMAFMLMLSFGMLTRPFPEKFRKRDFYLFGLAGFLMGTAVAAKIIASSYGFLILIFTGILLIRRLKSFSRTASLLGITVLGIMVAYLPWAIRGYAACGNPVFPLLSNVFPLRGEFAEMTVKMQKLMSLYPLSLSGLKEALFQGLFHKTYILLVCLDVLFLIILISAIWIIFRKRGEKRIYSLLCLSFYGIFIFMKGHNDAGRYFSLCYPVCIPLVGLFAEDILCNLKKRMRNVFILILLAGSMLGYVRNQAKSVSFPTIPWKCVPVVIPEARLAYAKPTETGDNFQVFEAVRPIIEKNATVLIPEVRFPYYIKRKAIWGLEFKWRKISENDILNLLIEKQPDYLLVKNPAPDPRLQSLHSKGILNRIILSDPVLEDWDLYMITHQIKERENQ